MSVISLTMVPICPAEWTSASTVVPVWVAWAIASPAMVLDCETWLPMLCSASSSPSAACAIESVLPWVCLSALVARLLRRLASVLAVDIVLAQNSMSWTEVCTVSNTRRTLASKPSATSRRERWRSTCACS